MRSFIVKKLSLKKIIYTPEIAVPGEIEKIVSLLESGADYLYLRKPQTGIEYWMTYIEQFPFGYEARMITSSYRLLHDLKLGGFHFQREVLKHLSETDLNENLKMLQLSGKISSVTAHDMESLKRYDGRTDIILIAPLFDSISKKGHHSQWDLNTLRAYIENRSGSGSLLIGQGGVDGKKISILKEAGMDGYALLGYLWNESETAVEKFKKLI